MKLLHCVHKPAPASHYFKFISGLLREVKRLQNEVGITIGFHGQQLAISKSENSSTRRKSTTREGRNDKNLKLLGTRMPGFCSPTPRSFWCNV
jgi:hypothetical protein